MSYSSADKGSKTAEKMLEFALSGKLIYCSRCREYTQIPFAKLSINDNAFIFCDFDCLDEWLKEYKRKSKAKVTAECDFDLFIASSIETMTKR